MTIPRRILINEHEIHTYHCYTRCVRRAYLCGKDKYSGKNYEHRKFWVENRLRYLSTIFAIDVCGFAAMNNHLHVILRNRPDLAETWSKEDITLRWWRLFPKRRNKTGGPAEPTEEELQDILSGRLPGYTLTAWVAELRRRLCSISWLMRCLNYNIARRANKEDDCTGRFWEGRFKSQLLSGRAAILACSAYVDLNPIRAGIAKTPETSAHTSIRERITSLKAQQRLDKADAIANPTKKQKQLLKQAQMDRHAADWLCPIGAFEGYWPDRRSGSKGKKLQVKGMLGGMTVEEYIALVDWTGRVIRRDRKDKKEKAAIPGELKPILERMSIELDEWVKTVEQFGNKFYRVVGTVEDLMSKAKTMSMQWLKGKSSCRAAFGESPG